MLLLSIRRKCFNRAYTKKKRLHRCLWCWILGSTSSETCQWSRLPTACRYFMRLVKSTSTGPCCLRLTLTINSACPFTAVIHLWRWSSPDLRRRWNFRADRRQPQLISRPRKPDGDNTTFRGYFSPIVKTYAARRMSDSTYILLMLFSTFRL